MDKDIGFDVDYKKTVACVVQEDRPHRRIQAFPSFWDDTEIRLTLCPLTT